MQPFVYFFNIITDFFKKEKNISLSFRNKFNFLLLLNISLFVIRNFCYVKYFCIEYKGEAKRENEIIFDYIIFFSFFAKAFFIFVRYIQTNKLFKINNSIFKVNFRFLSSKLRTRIENGL